MLQLRQSGGGQKMNENKDFKSFKRWCKFETKSNLQLCEKAPIE